MDGRTRFLPASKHSSASSPTHAKSAASREGTISASLPLGRTLVEVGEGEWEGGEEEGEEVGEKEGKREGDEDGEKEGEDRGEEEGNEDGEGVGEEMGEERVEDGDSEEEGDREGEIGEEEGDDVDRDKVISGLVSQFFSFLLLSLNASSTMSCVTLLTDSVAFSYSANNLSYFAVFKGSGTILFFILTIFFTAFETFRAKISGYDNVEFISFSSLLSLCEFFSATSFISISMSVWVSNTFAPTAANIAAPSKGALSHSITDTGMPHTSLCVRVRWGRECV